MLLHMQMGVWCVWQVLQPRGWLVLCLCVLAQPDCEEMTVAHERFMRGSEGSGKLWYDDNAWHELHHPLSTHLAPSGTLRPTRVGKVWRLPRSP